MDEENKQVDCPGGSEQEGHLCDALRFDKQKRDAHKKHRPVKAGRYRFFRHQSE